MYLFILSLFLSGGQTPGLKAQDMKTVFINMPDERIPQLEDAWRKDLVGLYESGKDSGKEARLQNMMNGYSTLKKLTADYLLLQTSEAATVEMKLLPLVNNTHIVCMVTTVNGPVPDSRVEFYTTEWQPLDAADLFSPADAGGFLPADTGSDAYKDAVARLDMDLIHYQLSPDSLTLTATYTTPAYLDKEGRKKYQALPPAPPKVYTWEKFHFK